MVVSLSILKRYFILFVVTTLLNAFMVNASGQQSPTAATSKPKTMMKKSRSAKTKTNRKPYHNRFPSPNNAENPFSNVYSLESIVADINRRATSGVIVRALPSGNIIYQSDASQLYTPASNMKILTAFAALKFLSPHFHFHTQLLTDATNANPVNGILEGNLYVKYDGDPTLTLEDMNALMRQLTHKGVRAIAGNLYVDSTRFDQQGIAPGTDPHDVAYCYGAPVSSGIFNRNCLSIRVLPSSLGEPARIVGPYDIRVPLVNGVVTQTSRACRIVMKHDEYGKCTLDGCISARRGPFPITITIPSGDEYGHNVAATLLARNGIRVLSQALPANNGGAMQLLASHESDPLSMLVLQMMKKSDNLIANSLFKTVGAHYNKTSATWVNSGVAVKNILQENGVNTEGMVIIDGSGLSRDDRVSPDQFSQVLVAAYHDPQIFNDYLEALPVGGINGTLRKRLSSRDIIGKVKAKTGSMHGVSSLSGYVETHNGQTLAFSIVVNGFVGGLYPYRAMEDNLCRVLNAKY